VSRGRALVGRLGLAAGRRQSESHAGENPTGGLTRRPLALFPRVVRRQFRADSKRLRQFSGILSVP